MSKNTNADSIKKVTVLGIVMNIIFCLIKATVGWIGNSQAVIADSISSIPALAAVLLCSIFPGIYYIDSIGAMIVSVFILKVAFDIMKPALGEMIDKSADQNLMSLIKEAVLSVEDVKSTHKIRSRVTSGAIFIDLHIQVDEKLSIADGHNISGRVKEKIFSLDSRIIDVLVHLEPEIAETEKVHIHHGDITQSL
ncbi:MAG: cation diffusion facilitator family transporter [Spirochaetales bacterium]|nr:cation diffusion facilitator family transporter [Spirochaetales bacterium]